MSKTKPTYKDDKPPILNSWNQLYWLVIICHILIISLFYYFSKAYS